MFHARVYTFRLQCSTIASYFHAATSSYIPAETVLPSYQVKTFVSREDSALPFLLYCGVANKPTFVFLQKFFSAKFFLQDFLSVGASRGLQRGFKRASRTLEHDLTRRAYSLKLIRLVSVQDEQCSLRFITPLTH